MKKIILGLLTVCTTVSFAYTCPTAQEIQKQNSTSPINITNDSFGNVYYGYTAETRC